MKLLKHKLYVLKQYFWLRILHFFNKPDCKFFKNNLCEFDIATNNYYFECNHSKKHPCCFNKKSPNYSG